MPRAGKPPNAEPVRTHVLGSHTEAKAKIHVQVEKGTTLLNIVIRSPEDLEEANRQKWKWHNYTNELLKTLFNTPDIAHEFEWAVGGGFASSHFDFYQEVSEFKGGIKQYISSLETIIEKVDLFPSQTSATVSPSAPVEKPSSNKVFVVHGHDEAAKQSLCRYLEALGLIPIVLHEQPNQGKTIIEKFEAHADVGFAVILLTPDDVGRATSAEALLPRARQNVIFEMGYFIGALKRSKVCCLFKKGVEIPSDYTGVIYTEMDEHSGWKLLLAREIRSSGIDIDMNKALA